MNIPKLRKNKTKKNYHGITLEDDYSWVDQPNILEVLKDPKKLDTEVKDYIEANNEITENYFKDVKDFQKHFVRQTLLYPVTSTIVFPHFHLHEENLLTNYCKHQSFACPVFLQVTIAVNQHK